MFEAPKKSEVLERIKKLFDTTNEKDSNWDAIFIFSKINQYYLTGTMQDGLFILKRDGSYAYFVRRSFERARLEALIDSVYPMISYRDILNFIDNKIDKLYTETEVVTYAMLERLKKYVAINEISSLDKIVLNVRALKSEYELSLIRESARQHSELFENVVPKLLKEGVDEASFSGELYYEMVKLGYHGMPRFAMFQTEIVVGQVGFGTNSLYPTSFDGPGGMRGMSPASPMLGERERRLKKGDLVFVDVGYGFDGYHTDRTQVYSFGSKPSSEVVEVHNTCLDIMKKTASLLKPNAIPSEVYNKIMSEIEPSFLTNFMGFGNRKVKFLGHGVGLNVDEYPIIANGFDEPLSENMVIALEPKKGVTDVGMVGVEDTYIVTKDGGECITGGEKEIIIL